MESPAPPQEHVRSLEDARTHLKAGRAAEAEAALARILATDAGNAAALHLMGAIALSRRDFAGALGHFRESLAADPGQAQAWSNLGAAHQALGRADEAIEALRRALELRPDHIGALNNLGVLHARRSEFAEAEACYARALALNGADPEVHNNLANVLLRSGRVAEAIVSYRRAFELKPQSADTLGNLGVALLRIGQHAQALATLKQALQLRPDAPDLLFNLGNAHAERGDLMDAIGCYRRALELKPDAPEIRDRLLHLKQRVCDWQGLEGLAAAQLAAVRSRPEAVISPFSIVCLPSSAEEQLLAARNWCRNMLSPVERLRPRLEFAFSPAPRSRLRIGYLSGDFRAHAVAHLVVELIEVHDRAGFEVHGYSYGPDDASPLRERVVAAFDRFTDIRALSHEEAARRIHADGIDILVDLSGYTQHSRAEILALRPAPVQVHYLGHPGTMGAGFIDYLLTDRFLTPPALARSCAEQLVYLPSHQVNDRRRSLDAIATRVEVGLPEDAFVFCCHAQSHKIWPVMFAAWMRILQAVPGSVLWLSQASPQVAGNLRREAAARGVDPERLRFALLVPYGDYLSRLALADLFLDTLPFNAHATAADALWAGLPVLTCAGDTHPARLAGSILTAAGLPELIATSLADYESRALQLAREPAMLAQLRARLIRERGRCALFDTPRFARSLENAYRQMWDRACRLEPPAAIDVSG
ncbi:MAG: tetratricopeptide repeat protein [Candidatus Parcubacteria bacterium]|nr:tetratricopeptide repeat protein [Burkholderiales bacterium]